MASFILNWQPAGGPNSKSQDIQYKIADQADWITYQNVAATVSTIEITGLADNVKYAFQIVDNCIYGGPVASPTVLNIKITCPSVNFNNTYNTIQFSFNHLGGSIKQYVITLMTMDGTILANQTITNLAAVITGSFEGVTPSTSYQIVVTPSDGQGRSCEAVTTATTLPPVCDPPTDVTVTLN